MASGGAGGYKINTLSQQNTMVELKVKGTLMTAHNLSVFFQDYFNKIYSFIEFLMPQIRNNIWYTEQNNY